MTATGLMEIEEASPSTAIATRSRSALLRPIAAPKDILESQDATRSLIAETLTEGRDYGKIPGIAKPSLLKPGAERVGLAFGCFPRYRIVEQEIDHNRQVEWRKKRRVYNNAHKGDKSYKEVEETGQSLGLYRYVVACEIVHRDSGQIVGECIGVCSTMEAKYVDRPRECENTALKMAEKRAHVGAVLNAFGLSDQFTQDVEDQSRGEAAHEDEPVEAITSETPIPFGKMQGKTLADLDLKFVEWMTEPGRKFGPRTDDWQKAAHAEIERRAMAEAQERTVPTAPAASTSHPVPPPGRVIDAIDPMAVDPTSKRAIYARIEKALESSNISPETREIYAEANVNGFKPPKHRSIEWWVRKLEDLARIGDTESAEPAVDLPF